MKNIHKILNFCIIPTFLRRYDFSILMLGKKWLHTKSLYKKDLNVEMEKYTRNKELYMSLSLINKQFMKQGLAITIATMKMNVTHATTEPQEIQQLGTNLNALFSNQREKGADSRVMAMARYSL